MHRLLLSVSKALRLKTLAKKTKILSRKFSLVFVARLVKPVARFTKDTYTTFFQPTINNLVNSLLPKISPITKKLKPYVITVNNALRPAVRKLSSLPHLAIVAAILTPLVSTLVLEIHNTRLYRVVDTEKVLLSRTSVKKDLIKDTEDSFLYNRKEELDLPSGTDSKLQQLLLSASKAETTGKEPYQAKLPKDPRDGILFGDAEGNRQFTITPDYGLSNGRMDDDSRIVYPKSTTERHIYTFKKNGIKNDITLLKAPAPDSEDNKFTKTYTYTLELGNELEARLLPTGDIGIFSADSKLFGNVQSSDQQSQELIDKARANNAKNTLVFEIPRPFIIDSTKKKNYDDVSFKLLKSADKENYSGESLTSISGNATLLLEVRNINNLPYPVSIDPTITVTTTADFQTNAGGIDNIDYSTDGQITRGTIGSGALNMDAPENTYATGGDSVYSYTGNGTNGDNGRIYWVHQFTTTGASTFTANQTLYIDYLLVGGGGGGGSSNLSQGGGGAGGYKTNVGGSVVTLTSGSYSVTVGAGGAGGLGTIIAQGADGGSSSLQSVASVSGGGGGGGGSAGNTSPDRNGRNGGSGGGAGHYNGTGGTAVSGEGNNGGASPVSVSTGGGGGGGAGAVGGAGSGSNGGAGGVGLQNLITGTATFYAGGGGGSRYTSTGTSGLGGNGGGGNAGTNSAGTNGTNGLGGGGGAGNGATLASCCSGGNGGSGTVIIRYPAPDSVSTYLTSSSNNASVAYRNNLYIIGGGTSNTIQRCPINSNNGSLNACVTEASTFTGGRSGHTALLYGDGFFIIGGLSSGSAQSDIQYCPIDPTTYAIGTCTRQTSAFSIARKDHSSVLYNGYLYIIGGNDGSSNYNDIFYCKIKSDNSVETPCTRQTSAFTTARSEHDSVVYNGYLYIIGGTSGSNQNDIQYCPINANGSVGTCVQQTSAFTTARTGLSTNVSGGYLYIIGGTSGSYQNDIQYCPINANGSVGTCTVQASGFATARAYHSSVIYNNIIYIVGGTNGSVVGDINMRKIATGGRVGATTSNSNNLNVGRSGHATVVHNGILYSIGGRDASNYYNDIERCTISSNGTVGTCTRQTDIFLGPRAHHSALVLNGYLYIIGGYTVNSVNSSGAYTNEISWCAINADGSIASSCGFASGGTITNYIADGTNGTANRFYNVHSFGTSGGTFNTNGLSLSSEYMVIGGGGGGGGGTGTNDWGGGGGAGGLVHNVGSPTSLSGSYTINVGAGGAGGNGTVGSSGGASSISGGVASVSGGGASTTSGGSGGGGNIGFSVSTAGSGTSGQGNAGGAGGTGGGGGGGKNGAGTTSSEPSCGTYCITYTGGNGGAGISLSITGTSAFYAGGGGGARDNANDDGANISAKGGSGIGGNGAISDSSAAVNGQNASANTGSGGGGGANTGDGGSGSAGAVIIRYVYSNTVTLTAATAYHTSVIYNGNIYVIGGFNGSYLRTIQRCPINTNGSVGTCVTAQTTALANARRGHTSVLFGNNLYVIGGETTGASLRSDIELCVINKTTGAIDSCTVQATTFTTARENLTSIIYNGYLYIIGGNNDINSATVYNDIQYCPISASGTLSSCTRQTNPFTTARSQLTAVEYNGMLYAVGGWSGSSHLNTIEYLRVGPPDGMTGTVTTNSNYLLLPRQAHSAVAYGGNLYITGGNRAFSDTDCKNTGVASNYCNDIQICPFNVDGTVGTCTVSQYFSTPRSSHTAVINNGYLYIIGGWNGTTHYDTIQYCAINATTGAVSTCNLTTASFSTGRRSHTSVVYNNYIYVVGGWNGTTHYDTIQYCAINTGTGDVSSCSSNATGFSTARRQHASVVFNGYLYVIGGWNGTTYYNDVQYCKLNANGTADTCTRQDLAFNTPRYALSAFINNEFLYIIGGQSSSASQNDVQYCPVSADGSIDMCMRQDGAITGARSELRSVAYRGRGYVVGGALASASTSCKNTGISEANCNDIQIVPLNTTSNSSSYERTIDTGSVDNTMFNLTISGSSSCDYKVTYSTAGSDNIYSANTVLQDVVPGNSIALNVIHSRYIRILISFEDAECGLSSNVTAVAITYNQKPSIPVITAPTDASVNISTFPEFSFGSSDVESDYLRYKIEVCADSACSSLLRTIDQTVSQTGWSGQTQQTGTAYAGGPSIVEYAKHIYQIPILETSTTYYWRAYAIDPAGSNTWSYPTSIYSFTTVAPRPVNITGNSTITGGSVLNP